MAVVMERIYDLGKIKAICHIHDDFIEQDPIKREAMAKHVWNMENRFLREKFERELELGMQGEADIMQQNSNIREHMPVNDINTTEKLARQYI